MLLLSLKSYATQPPISSTVATMAFYVGALFAIENLLKYLLGLEDVIGLHPILEIEVNRRALSRHLGVDLVSCLVVSYFGISGRHHLKEMRDPFWDRKAPISSYQSRMLVYIPDTHRLCAAFTAYQIKNFYDSWMWDDGVEFLVHHVLGGLAAWVGMYPGVAHVYGVFFMGISEISTTVLVVLSNFDDKLGVIGLTEALPVARAAIAALFTVTFVVCRIIIWPFLAMYFIQDTQDAMRNFDDKTAKSKLKILKVECVILVLLTVLQFLWLGQIFVMGNEEIRKMLA